LNVVESNAVGTGGGGRGSQRSAGVAG
jgi:hypothetical protein